MTLHYLGLPMQVQLVATMPHFRPVLQAVSEKQRPSPSPQGLSGLHPSILCKSDFTYAAWNEMVNVNDIDECSYLSMTYHGWYV